MKIKTRVLWIEDNAHSDYVHTVGPVLVDGRYDLVIAESASEGIQYVTEQEFDAVIVDLRLPPGDDRRWITVYNHGGSNRTNARLGLEVLHALLRPRDAKVRLEFIPKWVEPKRFAVFTVEPKVEVQSIIEMLDVNVYVQKTAEVSTRVILDILQALA
ncbi:MAG TPA: hypothetical protein VN687_19145 [Blastocatellia bacterium]|nr:hypothetical protein [Blastocatellia bacterium]